VDDTSGVASLLQRLEDRYDRDRRSDDVSQPSPLSPDIEEFLSDLDMGFDSSNQ
jgi:hypothetical protein